MKRQLYDLSSTARYKQKTSEKLADQNYASNEQSVIKLQEENVLLIERLSELRKENEELRNDFQDDFTLHAKTSRSDRILQYNNVQNGPKNIEKIPNFENFSKGNNKNAENNFTDGNQKQINIRITSESSPIQDNNTKKVENFQDIESELLLYESQN